MNLKNKAQSKHQRVERDKSPKNLQGLEFDIRVKKYGSLVLVGIIVLVAFLHKDNMSNLLAGISVFSLLLVIFLIGLKSDYKALKHYKSLLKENVKDKPYTKQILKEQKWNTFTKFVLVWGIVTLTFSIVGSYLILFVDTDFGFQSLRIGLMAVTSFALGGLAGLYAIWDEVFKDKKQ